MKGIYKVNLTDKVKKTLIKVPKNVSLKLYLWIDDINHRGLQEVRKIKGYHDEPLKGKREGQRSVRLNRSYRAIYEISSDNEIKFIEVTEVNKHEY